MLDKLGYIDGNKSFIAGYKIKFLVFPIDLRYQGQQFEGIVYHAFKKLT